MSVTLTPQTEAEIERLVESGRFPNADAAVASALEALKELDDARLERVRELVRIGFEGKNRRELTPELMDDIERRAVERYERGEIPASHVCP